MAAELIWPAVIRPRAGDEAGASDSGIQSSRVVSYPGWARRWLRRVH